MTNYTNPETLAWFGGGAFMDADSRDWVIFMTADELGLTEPKWMIDHATGELLLSFPSDITATTTEVAA